MHIKHLAVNLAYMSQQMVKIVIIRVVSLAGSYCICQNEKLQRLFCSWKEKGLLSDGILLRHLLPLKSLISSVWLRGVFWPSGISSGEGDMTSDLSLKPCVSRLRRMALGSNRWLMNSEIWT